MQVNSQKHGWEQQINLVVDLPLLMCMCCYSKALPICLAYSALPLSFSTSRCHTLSSFHYPYPIFVCVFLWFHLVTLSSLTWVVQLVFGIFHDALPSPELDPNQVQITQIAELFGTWGTLPALNIKRGQRGVLKLRDEIRKSDKPYLLTRTCIKPTNKLVNSLSGAPLVLGHATGNSRLTRLITAQTRGKPPPSPI